MAQHLILVGALGHVGRFASSDATRYPRGTRVVCRTTRGLEIGRVLSPEESGSVSVDGSILRRVGIEDDLILARLQQSQTEAYEACVELLAARGQDVVLMDVEHLFDGQSLYFYFLGKVPPEVEALTEELAQAYAAQVRFEQFSELLTHGCGPGCGTEEASGGCQENGCSTCAMRGACQTATPAPT